MRLSMQRGERIELRGFGVFQVKPGKRGNGRNPRTGKEVRIPPGRTIRFKPGKDLQNIGGFGRVSAAFPTGFSNTGLPVDPWLTWWPAPKFQHRYWKHVLLFVVTLIT